jgi:hypothetical protein
MLRNPSFEGKAERGSVDIHSPSLLLKEWTDCTEIWGMKYQSPYDVHTATSSFWGITRNPSHGKSFISLVVRETDTFEGISQKLEKPLETDKCYELKIDISKSYVMQSQVMSNPETQNFNTDALLNISFHNTLCGSSTYKTKSKPINHSDWKTYKFQFQPKEDYRFITLNAFWETPVLMAYNGNILLDNLSHIKEIECTSIEIN